MTKKCFYCGGTLSEYAFLTDKATMIAPQTYAHPNCIASHRKENMMKRKCLYCGETLVVPEFETGLAVKTGRDRYAHTDCIDSHGKEPEVSEEEQRILGAADACRQGIDLAISLLQESLGNMGEILTQGCFKLGPASLGSAMRLGQSVKEVRFILDDLLKGAHGLCILLGNDLGILDGKSTDLDGASEKVKRGAALWYKSSRALGDDPESDEDKTDDFHERMFGNAPVPDPKRPVTAPDYHKAMTDEHLADLVGEPLGTPDHRDLMDVLDSEDLAPGEDKFDDDEIPF